jgi:hypothetical protein
VGAGPGVRDHLRAAIQTLSARPPRRTVHTATGWCCADGTPAYLHAGGAIGPLGPLEGVTVDLPEPLQFFVLPDPPDGEALAAAVRAQLGQLDGLAPDGVILPLVAATLRSVLPGADFSAHVAGRSGVFKSELAALQQQHYGAALHARNLPASWSSTGNALEVLAFSARHALLVVDDFCPAGGTGDVQRYHREADRLLRAQGNRSGRQRLRPDGSPRPTRAPRGLILSTGEDTPRGLSLRARLLVIEVGPADVRVDRLTACQRDAAAGRYAEALAGYVRWLAGRYDQALEELRAETLRLRAEVAAALGGAAPGRTPTMVADLLAGFALYLRFARDAGAIDEAAAEALGRRCRAALVGLARDQTTHQAEADPVERYVSLLVAVLSSGRGHVAGPTGDRPDRPGRGYGWRVDGSTDRWLPQGRRIGWVDGADLYLDPEASYAEVQRLAQEQGEPFPVNSATLHRRLRERQLLAQTDPSRKKILVRNTLEGCRRYVLQLIAGKVLSLDDGGPKGPEGPSDEHPRENEPIPGAHLDHGPADGPLTEAHSGPEPGNGPP